MRRAVTQQQSYLSRLDSRVKKLVAEERARQERLARERAAAAARLAAQSGGGRAGREFDPAALGAPRPEAVAVARRFVGKVWYQWGGTTPAGFDCSGLVLYCYREVGVSLPRTSRQQYRVGAYIPPDRLDLLEPGDLVFFGRDGDPNRVHHVGMYIGGGSMIHAPQTGEMVGVGSLIGRIASRGDYVGAVRP
jgi:cell wall-associated NlpC family hydrolase